MISSLWRKHRTLFLLAINLGVAYAVAQAKSNDYSAFYRSVHDQIMSRWHQPIFSKQTSIDPVITIHVEKNGRVPAEGVHLVRSSGDSSCDSAAVLAAKKIGSLNEPLPEGCPADIPIAFKLTR